MAAAEDGGVEFSVECALATSGLDEVLVHVEGVRIDSAAPATLALIVTDFTAQARQRSQLEFLGSYDSLTGLLNRNALLRSATQALIRAKTRHVPVGFLLVDLDNFSRINDDFGPDAGDTALMVIGECLKQCVRGADIVGRYGGDEFLVVLTEMAHIDDAAIVASRVNQALRETVVMDGTMQLAASIGIALYPQDGSDLSMLLARANAALYLAKGAGRDCYAFAEATEDLILAFEPIAWNADAQIGMREIDEAHRQLVERINAIGRDLANGRDIKELRGQIDSLLEALVAHFKTEEDFMVSESPADRCAAQGGAPVPAKGHVQPFDGI